MKFVVDTSLISSLGLKASVVYGFFKCQTESDKDYKIDGVYSKFDADKVAHYTKIPKREVEDIVKAFVKCNLMFRNKSDKSYYCLGDIKNADLSKFSLTDFEQVKQYKKESKINSLLNLLSSNNEELREAYRNWLNVLYERFGFLTTDVILEAENKIDKYSERDLDVALDVLSVATSKAYKDVYWAIKLYDEKKKSNDNVRTTVYNKEKSVLSGEVF